MTAAVQARPIAKAPKRDTAAGAQRRVPRTTRRHRPVESPGADPTRAPSWRLIRVHELLDERQRPDARVDDRWVREAHSVCRKLPDADTAVERRRLQKRHPHMFHAFQVYQNRRFVRWFIEAMILANASRESIGESHALDEAVVESYEMMFFDVRDRLDARGFISSTVLAPCKSNGTMPATEEFVWKVLGFYAGEEILHDYLSHGRLSPELRQFLDEDTQARLLKAAWLAARILQVDEKNAKRALAMHERSQRKPITRAPDTRKDDEHELLESVQSQMRWIMAQRKAPGVDPGDGEDRAHSEEPSGTGPAQEGGAAS